MIDLRKARLFVAVFEAGSITRAAEREHIAQPALTVHIQQLEDELKVKLFERSAQGVTPTPAGRHLYVFCQDLLRRLESIGEEMRSFTGDVAGSIVAGIMPSICHGPLPPVLARYTATYPNVSVRIIEGLSGTLAEWVLANEVDFAICNRPASARELSQRLLVTDRLVLVSARDRGLIPFAPCKLGEIADLKLVLPSANHFLRHTLDHAINGGDFRPIKTLEIDGQSATLQFVAHSDWSTILPTIALINEFDSHRFTINPIEQPLLSTEIYELRSPRHTLSAASERFIALLEAQLRAAPGLPSPQEASPGGYRRAR
jgi:LysR family transcriptional regulator, nitrogen assimilation regulatory protein